MKYIFEVNTDENKKITSISARIPNSEHVIELPERILNDKGKKVKVHFIFIWRLVKLVDDILSQGE